MHRLRWIPILALLVPVLTACSGAGYGGGAYGGGAVSSPAPTVAPAASVAAAPTASGAPSGGGRGDYGTSASASPTAASGAASSTAPGSVHLTGFKFDPATAAVVAGSNLTFTNDDSIGHTIVEGENGTPAAGQTPQPVAPGKTVSLAFGSAGTVKLTCTIHPAMSMTVTVTP
jgi:plastocyanin